MVIKRKGEVLDSELGLGSILVNKKKARSDMDPEELFSKENVLELIDHHQLLKCFFVLKKLVKDGGLIGILISWFI